MEIEVFTEEELERDVHALIDYLRNVRRLSPTKCYHVIKIAYEGFPEEYIPKKMKSRGQVN